MLFVLHDPWYRARVLADNFCLSFAVLRMRVGSRAGYVAMVYVPTGSGSM
jgi:hypothetical protein